MSVMFNLARSMIFLWAPFFLRTDLEKQIGPVACQPQMWAVAPPGLTRTGSVCPSLENSLSLCSQGVNQWARSLLTQRQREPCRSHSLNVTPMQPAACMIIVFETVITSMTANMIRCLPCSKHLLWTNSPSL